MELCSYCTSQELRCFNQANSQRLHWPSVGHFTAAIIPAELEKSGTVVWEMGLKMGPAWRGRAGLLKGLFWYLTSEVGVQKEAFVGQVDFSCPRASFWFLHSASGVLDRRGEITTVDPFLVTSGPGHRVLGARSKTDLDYFGIVVS